ncbi:MAG: N-acetyl-gamma-glutamyl-phosphate reductase, partial [Myxococcales bacterium]|nr:N-acetyl-gamma-glutamyl-phosphate reductase [Myxococcales bacterium]
MKRVIVEGASGYAGMELTRLLSWHPHLRLVGVGSNRWAGSTVQERLSLSGSVGELRYEGDPSASDVDGVFLATPPEASHGLIEKWRARGVAVVDLSNALRAREDVPYGLTEHFREALHGAPLIANPGCYPTATLNALLPFVQAGLVAEGMPVIVDAKSGATGAGRKNADHLLFNELDQNHFPYRVGRHQHVPEIERFANRSVVFTPHLLPTRRGLLSTVYFH